MGAATIEAELIQKLAAKREAVLFEVFLYIQKSCDALDFLGILAEYGVGPRTIRLLLKYWSLLTMVARASG